MGRLFGSRFRALALLGMVAVSAVAYAAVVHRDEVVRHMLAGTIIGRTGTQIDDSYAGSTTFNFASVTTTCEDSTGFTVTGAATGDVCIVGVPSTGGSSNGTYSCYVSAADTVKVRHCAAGTADDPASATFTVRVFDP